MSNLYYGITISFKETENEARQKKQVYYYAQKVLGQKVNFDELCEELAYGSTVGVANVKALVSRMVTVISRNLKHSCAVDCGDLDTFRPSVRSKASESVEDFDIHLMKHPAVIFTLKPDFKNSLIGTSFRAVSHKFVVEGSDDGDTPSTTEGESDLGPNGKHSGL